MGQRHLCEDPHACASVGPDGDAQGRAPPFRAGCAPDPHSGVHWPHGCRALDGRPPLPACCVLDIGGGGPAQLPGAPASVAAGDLWVTRCRRSLADDLISSRGPVSRAHPQRRRTGDHANDLEATVPDIQDPCRPASPQGGSGQRSRDGGEGWPRVEHADVLVRPAAQRGRQATPQVAPAPLPPSSC